MGYEYRFEKILSLKEKEKDEALSIYNDAVKRFEETAEKLYELLRKKEDLENFQAERLSSGLPVQEIRHHQKFVMNLQKSIDHYQTMVINARNTMNFQQEKLMQKNIEVKKYIKMKEKDKLKFLDDIKSLESKQMDDISIQHYVNRES